MRACVKRPDLITITGLAMICVIYPGPGCRAQSQQAEIYQAALDSLLIQSVRDLSYHPTYGILIGDVREVWRIKPDGETAHIYAPGQGPGEFLNVTAVAWGATGELLIGNRRNARIVIYSNDLEFERQFPFTGVDQIAVSDDGHIFINTNIDSRGPVVELDPSTSEAKSLTEWRPSMDLMGVPEWKSASLAFLRWNRKEKKLFAAYRLDALVEVFENGEKIRSFQVEHSYVPMVMQGNIKRNRDSGGRSIVTTQALDCFCFVNDQSEIFISFGGHPILATLDGVILCEAPQPLFGYSGFYEGPEGTILAMNRDTGLVEVLSLADIFPDR